MVISKRKAIISLLVILVIATFFRLWQLDLVPPGLYPDEALNGNDALDLLQEGKFKLFYPENNGREGLFVWLIALSFSIFGASVWAIKIVPAIFGILTVLGVYFLAKELFRKCNENCSRCIGLLASFFLAISFWHINFSRIGFRAILVPFLLVFGFYFLFRGLRTKKALQFIASGIFFGLGFYTYISYRFVVLLLAIILIPKIYKKRKLQRKYLSLISLFLIFTFLVALPIGIYFLQNPQDFFGRAAGVSVFAQENPIYEIGKSLILHLGMFNFYGDGNWRHNFAGSPVLLWPIGIFFLIGLVLSIKELISVIKKKGFRFSAEGGPAGGWHTSGFLIAWFLIMLLPGILSYEGIPHALRVIGVIPVAYILAGLGACWLFRKTKCFFKTKNQVIAFYLCLSVLFLAISCSQFNKYFYQWGKRPETEGAFSKNYVEVGNYLNSLPDDIEKYVIVNQAGVPVPWPDGIPVPAQTPMFIEKAKFGQIRSIYLLPENLNQIKIDKEKGAVIVPLQYDEDLLLKIVIFFPGGKFQEKNGNWIYEIY